MRILLATPSFAPQLGGAETWTRAVFGYLTARGHHVEVVARASTAASGSHEIDGIAVARVPGGRAAFASATWRAVSSAKPDVVVAQYAALPFAAAAARRRGVPMVAIVHDVYGWRESVRIKGAVAGTARWLGLEQVVRVRPPDHVLAPSRATARRVRGLLPHVDVTVVPAGTDHIATTKHQERQSASVLFVGRLVHQKGVHDLINAVAALRVDQRDVTLTMVGRGPERDRIRAHARRLALPVVFYENIANGELDALMCTASVLALPSTREGWGLAITEAAVRATPYVAYDIPAVHEQHELLGGGALVPPNAAALTAALRAVLADPAAARSAAERAAEVARTWTWKRSAEVVDVALHRVVR